MYSGVLSIFRGCAIIIIFTFFFFFFFSRSASCNRSAGSFPVGAIPFFNVDGPPFNYQMPGLLPLFPQFGVHRVPVPTMCAPQRTERFLRISDSRRGLIVTASEENAFFCCLFCCGHQYSPQTRSSRDRIVDVADCDDRYLCMRDVDAAAFFRAIRERLAKYGALLQ